MTSLEEGLICGLGGDQSAKIRIMGKMVGSYVSTYMVGGLSTRQQDKVKYFQFKKSFHERDQRLMNITAHEINHTIHSEHV